MILCGWLINGNIMTSGLANNSLPNTLLSTTGGNYCVHFGPSHLFLFSSKLLRSS